MSYRVRVALKVAVWIASLWPLGVLVRGFLTDDLDRQPDRVHHPHPRPDRRSCSCSTSLGMTPLRALFGWSWPIQLRRLLGLLAFFYVCLHFAVWIGLDHFFAWRRMWEDVLKRPFITVGMLALVLLIPLAATSTSGMIKRLGGAQLAAAAQARLRDRRAGRAALPVAGEEGAHDALLLRDRARAAAGRAALGLAAEDARAQKHEPSPPVGERAG